MKNTTYLTLFYLFLSTGLWAQSPQNMPSLPPTDSSYHARWGGINFEKFYVDAGGGYFPESKNASWAGQLSAGYRLTPKIALGVGSAYWGRINTYQRSALGVGVQYRQILWDNIIVKAEIGYLLKTQMHDNVLHKTMDYVAQSSTPPYYKLDINWRLKHYVTLGISACQTSTLTFRRHLPDASTTLDNWRINALTIQLGIALDTPD